MGTQKTVSVQPKRIASNAWLSPPEHKLLSELARENGRSFASELRMAARAWLEAQGRAA